MEYSLHNNFFNLKYDFQISYFIYIYPTLRNKDYIFSVSLLDDDINIFIMNKVINRADNFKIKIMKNDSRCSLIDSYYKNRRCNKITLCKWYKYRR